MVCHRTFLPKAVLMTSWCVDVDDAVDSVIIREDTVYYFSYFKRVDVCFATQGMVKLGERSWLFEKNLCSAVVRSVL